VRSYLSILLHSLPILEVPKALVFNSAQTPAPYPEVAHHLQRAWRLPAAEKRYQFGSSFEQAQTD
jgi:hypothetical protein